MAFSSRLNGQGLLIQASNNLLSTYANLMTGNTNGGLTLDNILNPSDSVNKNYLNTAFSQYLTTNFSSMDKNSDGKITQDEVQKVVDQMSTQGITYNQLVQLCNQNGSNTLLDTVMSHFNEIDKNHDGKVTNQEISGYGIEEESEKVKNKYKAFNPNSFSVFYSDSITNTEESSVLDEEET